MLLAVIGVALAGAHVIHRQAAAPPAARTGRPALAPRRGSLPRCGPVLALASDNTATAKQQRLSELERALAEAVSAEKYDEAISLRDEIAAFKLDAEVGILSANAEFYAAFSGRSLSRMDDLWAASEDVTCIHPGHAPMQTRKEVMDSWAEIFGASGNPLEVNAANVRCHVHGSIARITCIEELKPGGGKLAATNMFEQREEDGRWLMVLHQAGPIMT